VRAESWNILGKPHIRKIEEICVYYQLKTFLKYYHFETFADIWSDVITVLK